MSEYNFVVYEKLDGDAHTDRMLAEEHHGNVPEEITDKQLSSHRVNEQEVTIEKQLEKNRTGVVEKVIEKNLNTAKTEYGTKHRDASTYEGDINKLEEQRVKERNIEKEKYEVASEVPKRQRWWDVKTKDGLKIAFKKEAQWEPSLDDVDWDYLENRGNDIEEENLDFPIDEMDVQDDFGDFSVDDMGDDMGDDVLKEVSYEVVDAGGTPKQMLSTLTPPMI